MSTVIFLGAGASAADGAPIQSALFEKFFGNSGGERTGPQPPDMDRSLREYFRKVFGVNSRHDVLSEGPLPTFEEALGVLDLLAMRCESLRGFDIDAFADSPGDHGTHPIRLVRHYLILAMGKAIDDGIVRHMGGPAVRRWHKTLARKLVDEQLLKDTVFISMNYDLLIDEALRKALPPECPEQTSVDYGVEVSGQHLLTAGGRQSPYVIKRVRPDAVRLLKIHGSLGWLHCATCNCLRNYEYKAVLSCIASSEDAVCRYCDTLMSPLIVPPTYYKDMSKVFLGAIWNKAETALREAGHVIFCGYSFPDADMHVKYLLKRAQTNRPDPASLRFTIVNNHPGKDSEQREAEEHRYRRFLGEVNFTEFSFEEFADSPQSFFAENG